MKALKVVARVLLILLLLVILVVGGYVLYMVLQYDRIKDNQVVPLSGGAGIESDGKETYTITTYNIGFGAYDHEFSFFMDSGEMKDGTKKTGTQSRAASLNAVKVNTDGAIGNILAQDTDFALFQEVDENAQRSHKFNQRTAIENAFPAYVSAYASNFHSGYLFYPVFKPHGAVNSGIMTLSKYKVASGGSVRYRFPIDESFPNKFFDLDRCFTVTTVQLGDKTLSLFNVHLSAYDDGGVRDLQLAMLNEAAMAAHDAGNYVIIGGDFNHDIAYEAAAGIHKDSLSQGNGNDLFPSGQKRPEWVQQMKKENLPGYDAGKTDQPFAFADADNFDEVPTCRSSDMPYTLDENGGLVNYTVIIDGFIVSRNIEIVEVVNVDTAFEFSDHQPVRMQFKFRD